MCSLCAVITLQTKSLYMKHCNACTLLFNGINGDAVATSNGLERDSATLKHNDM